MAFDSRDSGGAENPYAPLMGRSYVGFDETGAFTVLDGERRQTLSAWVGRVIPSEPPWPGADELDTVAYIDAVIAKAPELRPTILSGIDRIERTAQAAHRTSFHELPIDAQVAILTEAEATLAPAAFSVVVELTYEAYYRHPQVQQVVKERTGFDVRNTIDGKPMKPFPIELLTEVGERPDRYRSVPA